MPFHVGLPTGDNFKAKAPGLVNGGSAPPTLTAYTREPLAHISGAVRLIPSRRVNKVLS